jgi:hypothetical protein
MGTVAPRNGLWSQRGTQSLLNVSLYPLLTHTCPQPKTGNTIEAFVAKAMNSTVAPYTATASAILTGAGVAGKSHPSSLVNPTDPIDPPASSYVSQLPASAANGTSAAGTASGSASSPTATTKSSANKVTLGAGLSLVGAVVALFV